VSRRFQDELAARLAEWCDDRVPSIRRQAIAAIVHLARRNHEASRHRVEAWLHPEQRLRRVIETLRIWGTVRLTAEDPLVMATALGKLDDADSEVRNAAAHALAAMATGPAAQQTLLSKLDDPKARVRSCAASALTSVAATPLVQESLLRRLDDTDSGVRTAAVRALTAVAAVSTVQPALLRRVDDPNPAVRAAAVHAMTLLSSATPVQYTLVRKLEDPTWRVREAAVESLAPVATVKLVQEALMHRLGDPEPLVRAAAVKALRSVAAEPLVQAALLKSLADDQYPWVRTAAVDSVAKALADQLPWVHTATAEASVTVIQQALLRKLTDDNPQVRVAATRGLLRQVGLEKVRKALTRAFEDPEPGVRLAAASAFLTDTNPDLQRHAVELIRSALRTPLRWVRQQAIAVVSQMAQSEGVSDAVRDLLNLIQQDADEAIRDSAFHAVHRLLTARSDFSLPRAPAV
jgi:HEAT repeat protein